MGNLDFDTNAETIKDAFEVYGEVKDVYIPVDGMGSARGFAFLSMGPEDAQKAIDNMTGTQLDGRRINVNKSLPKGQKSQRSQRECTIRQTTTSLAHAIVSDIMLSLAIFYFI